MRIMPFWIHGSLDLIRVVILDIVTPNVSNPSFSFITQMYPHYQCLVNIFAKTSLSTRVICVQLDGIRGGNRSDADWIVPFSYPFSYFQN